MAITHVGSASYNGASQATTASVTVPTVADGDVAILFVGTASGATTISSIAGIAGSFTEVAAKQTYSGHSHFAFTAPLVAADSGDTITVTTSNSVRTSINLLVLRGVNTSAPVAAYDARFQSVATTTVTTETLVTPSADCVEVSDVAFSNNTTAITSITSSSYTVAPTAYPSVAAGTIALATGRELTARATGYTIGGLNFVADQSRGYSTWTLAIAPIPAANVDPVADAGTDQTVAAGATVSLSGSATDSDGTISSVAWTQLSGPTVTLSATNVLNPTFTAPGTSSIVTLRLTVTDNAAATDTDDVTIRVTGTSASPHAVDGSTDFTAVGAGSIVSALSDVSDSTLAQSPDNPDGEELVLTLTPLAAGPVTVTTRDRQTDVSPVINRVVEIINDADEVLGTSAFDLTTTATNHTTTTSAPVAAGVSLRVRVTDTVEA